MLDAGASVPGFRVAEVEPEQWVRLVGRHRFSRYALVLTLDARPDGTLLRAGTYAEFPGLHGGVYRAMVISSGGHGVIVDRDAAGDPPPRRGCLAQNRQPAATSPIAMPAKPSPTPCHREMCSCSTTAARITVVAG